MNYLLLVKFFKSIVFFLDFDKFKLKDKVKWNLLKTQKFGQLERSIIFLIIIFKEFRQ